MSDLSATRLLNQPLSEPTLARASIQKQCAPQYCSSKEVQVATGQIAYDAYGCGNCQQNSSTPDVALRGLLEDIGGPSMFFKNVSDKIGRLDSSGLEIISAVATDGFFWAEQSTARALVTHSTILSSAAVCLTTANGPRGDGIGIEPGR
jgi:hypothetical protein